MGITDTGEASTAPAKRTAAVDVSASNAEFNTGPTLYIGTGGTIIIDGIGDAPGTMTPFVVPDGTWMPVRVARIYSAGTDAENIVAIW